MGEESTIKEEHFSDENGNPAGGTSYGVGFAIGWQNGPLRKDGIEKPRNGAFVEDVTKAVIGRIEYYQQSRFACKENEDALMYLKEALACMNARTANRQNRGVEGTHQI